MSKKNFFIIVPTILVIGLLTDCKKAVTVTLTNLTATCNTAFEVSDQIKRSDIKVTATYSDDTTKNITDWKCSDFKGDTYTFTDKDSPKKKFDITYEDKSCSVEVSVSIVPVSEFNLDKKTLEFTISNDESYKLIATIGPDKATYKDIKWTCLPENYFKFSKTKTTSGEEVTVSLSESAEAGKASITATSISDPNKFASCDVIINPEWSKYLTFSIVNDDHVVVKQKESVVFKGHLEIPETVDGRYVDGGVEGENYIVEGIKESGFAYSFITSVSIPSSIKKISFGAFNNSFLESIVFNEGLEEIEYGAFYNCLDLETFTLPSTLKKIGSYAFNNCKFSTITLPVNVVSIGHNAFSPLESIIFEDIFAPWLISENSSEEYYVPDSDGKKNAEKFNNNITKNFSKNEFNMEIEVAGFNNYILDRSKISPSVGKMFKGKAELNFTTGTIPHHLQCLSAVSAPSYIPVKLGYKENDVDINITRIDKTDKEGNITELTFDSSEKQTDCGDFYPIYNETLEYNATFGFYDADHAAHPYSYGDTISFYFSIADNRRFWTTGFILRFYN